MSKFVCCYHVFTLRVSVGFICWPATRPSSRWSCTGRCTRIQSTGSEATPMPRRAPCQRTASRRRLTAGERSLTRQPRTWRGEWTNWWLAVCSTCTLGTCTLIKARCVCVYVGSGGLLGADDITATLTICCGSQNECQQTQILGVGAVARVYRGRYKDDVVALKLVYVELCGYQHWHPSTRML